MTTINNNISEDYVSFEVAKLLKEKGFDIPTETYYHASNVLGTKESFELHILDNKLKANYNFPSYCGLYLRPTLTEALEWIKDNFKLSVDKDDSAIKDTLKNFVK